MPMKHTHSDAPCAACGLLGSEGCLWEPRPVTLRPSQRDEVVVQEACKKLLPQVMNWIEGDSEEDEVLQDLIDAVSSSSDSDGYKLARELETHNFWDVDSELVDILSNVFGHLQDEFWKAEAVWVKEYDIMPKLKIGDRVKWKGKDGFVNGVEEKQGRYVVRHDSEVGKFGGYLVNYEDVE